VPSLIDHGTKKLEQVKRRSQETLLNSSDPIKTLKIIDTIQRLGFGHHFEEEINVKLGKLGDWDFSEDLFSTALQFRLLRHNGWPTSSGKLICSIVLNTFFLFSPESNKEKVKGE